MKKFWKFGLAAVGAVLLAALVPGGWMMLPLFGAVTVTQVQRDNNGAVFHITATADADAAATITHGLGRVPRSVRIMPILSQALAALSAWTLDVPLGVTTVTLTKLATVGSGNAAVQLRVELDN